MVKRLRRHAAVAAWRAGRLPDSTRAMLWGTAAGLSFSTLNAIVRAMAQQLDPFQAQFLRYLCGVLVMVPFIWHAGLAAYRPRQTLGHFTRGFVHTIGLVLWFIALPRITLADMTAIGFTTPIFILIAAGLFLKEPMRWDRWVAVALGFTGVLIVVGPNLSGAGGHYNLIMLASAPVFALSFLLAKQLTRHESTEVIVLWQALSVMLFSLPLAIGPWQNPSLVQWGAFALAGALGSIGHFCLTRAMTVAEISASQSVKFLDLIWAMLLGWLLFGDSPTANTFAGGAVVFASTLWIAHRESRSRPPLVGSRVDDPD